MADEQSLGSAWTPEQVEVVRALTVARVREIGLRPLAREIGLSPSGLRKVIGGSRLNSTTLAKLEHWMLTRDEPPEDSAEVRAVAAAAFGFLLEGLPERAREALRAGIEARIREAREQAGLGEAGWMGGM